MHNKLTSKQSFLFIIFALTISLAFLFVGPVSVAYLGVGRTTFEESKTIIKIVKKAIFLYIDTIKNNLKWLFISSPSLFSPLLGYFHGLEILHTKTTSKLVYVKAYVWCTGK